MQSHSFSLVYFVLLIVVGFSCGYLFHKPQVKTVEVEVVKTKHDTTVLFKDNYVFVNMPSPVFYETHDTLMVADTVYIKDLPEEYTFNEEDYDLNIKATHLYGYELDIHKTVPFTYEDTHTTTTVTKTKNRVITFGPQVGVGYGIVNRQPDIYVGFGINLNLF